MRTVQITDPDPKTPAQTSLVRFSAVFQVERQARNGIQQFRNQPLVVKVLKRRDGIQSIHVGIYADKQPRYAMRGNNFQRQYAVGKTFAQRSRGVHENVHHERMRFEIALHVLAFRSAVGLPQALQAAACVRTRAVFRRYACHYDALQRLRHPFTYFRNRGLSCHFSM